MALKVLCCPCTPAGLFPSPTWLVLPSGVCERLSKGEILRLLFTVMPALRSLLAPLLLLWGPVRNSSASSIIIPFVGHVRTRTMSDGWKTYICKSSGGVCIRFFYLFILLERVSKCVQTFGLIWVDFSQRRRHQFQVLLIISHLSHRDAVEKVWHITATYIIL